MHRCQYYPTYNATLDCVNADGTPCDYAFSKAVNTAGFQPYPWGWGCPSGTDGGNGAGLVEDCIAMFNASSGLWNDYSCFQKMGGVVCKRNCTGTCGSTPTKTALITPTSVDCTAGNWTRRKGEDGSTYGYQVVMKDWLNFYEAQAQCLAIGAEVVSIHTSDENEFVRQLAAPYINACLTNTSVCSQRVSTAFDSNLRVLWLGMHRSAIYPYYNNTLDSINSDGTPCDYFNITGASGTEDSTANTQQEACVVMYSSTTGAWNDMACYNKQGGVICKINCSATATAVAQCGVGTTTTTAASTTTTELSTSTTTTEPSTSTTTTEPSTSTTTTEPSTSTTTTEPSTSTTTTEPSTSTTTTEPSTSTTTTEPSTSTTTTEPSTSTTTTELTTTTTFNCAQPPKTALMTYNISDPKIQTENTTRAGVCDCLGSPGDKNVYFIPVTNVTTGSQASSSPVIMRCSKMQDFCVCDEDDICWRMINAYALIVINSFCDPICHMYARLTNSAPFTQALESDCGRRITLADELTPINNKTNTFKPLNSSADYYVKATSIRCLSAGQTCTPIKCTDTARANPCGTSTRTTAPSTSTTTTAPSTSTTTTAPFTTTTAPFTTTTAPSTSTTTTAPSTSTTTTAPSTTTTAPSTSTTTTAPSTTTTAPSTSTHYNSTFYYNTCAVKFLFIIQRNYHYKSKIFSKICYTTSAVNVARINCTNPALFCVCASNVQKGCFTPTNTSLLADYSIYANASSTFLVINTGSSPIINSDSKQTYKISTPITLTPGSSRTLNAPYLAVSCNGCSPIHNNGADTQKPC
uniref:C-type lectin domain-containing protein n=1 Tax=Meloidogyne hapla TaxID=6305 RepID=A0A1I8BP69_MELHA